MTREQHRAYIRRWRNKHWDPRYARQMGGIAVHRTWSDIVKKFLGKEKQMPSVVQT